jgi:ketosteroid isomerase-like protein
VRGRQRPAAERAVLLNWPLEVAMTKRLLLSSVLLVACGGSASAQDPPAGVGAEVERGVAAYNAQDLKYYEGTLAPDVVYIADDGATFVGRERVLGLFGRLFTATPKRRMVMSDLVAGGKGEVGWARFKWTITRGDATRKGVCSTVLTRAGDSWQAVLIQNTPDGHGAAAH